MTEPTNTEILAAITAIQATDNAILGIVAPIVFDAVGTSGNVLGTSFSWSHDATAGAYVLAGFCTQQEGSDPAVTAATYGGADMVLIGSVPLNNVTAHGELYLYGLADVPGGTQTVAVTMNTELYCLGNSVSYISTTATQPTVLLDDVQTVYGYGTDATLPDEVVPSSPEPAMSQTVTCPPKDLIVQVFGNQGIATMSSPAGGNNRYFGTSNGSLSISDAAASTTFTAELDAGSVVNLSHGTWTYDVWSGISVPLTVT